MIIAMMSTRNGLVALRKESVDRNPKVLKKETGPSVALRKESVDRNKICGQGFRLFWVALRKESVDRNLNTLGGFGVGNWSLSARRAWIEILI